jgi:hypothetical protein
MESRAGRSGAEMGCEGIAHPQLPGHLRTSATRSQHPDRGEADLSGHDLDFGKGMLRRKFVALERQKFGHLLGKMLAAK